MLREDGSIAPTIENFYRFCARKQLMGVRCKRCNNLMVPPRVICPKCYSSEFDWVELSGRGKLLTYTIVYYPPTMFQALAPYAVGIVGLEEGVRLPGMIKNVRLEDLKIGMDLVVDFEVTIPKDWPKWPRYFFRLP